MNPKECQQIEDAALAADRAVSAPGGGSPVWIVIGEWEVSTWPGPDQDRRARMQLAGWFRLGAPIGAESIRKANTMKS